MAPPGILGKNSSKYRVASFAQHPHAGGLVVLTNLDGTYLMDGGEPVTAKTDAAGRYDFGAHKIPSDRDVMVTATFPGNRMLVQYAHAAPGDNQADVDAAGTYVSSYFVARSRKAGREPVSYDRTRLPVLREWTRTMLDDGTLAFEPDLFALDRTGDLVTAYAAAFRARAPRLAAA
jgi:hypothetical protein